MNCRRRQRAIALYVAGDLAPRKHERLEGHLERCPTCREFAQGIRESREALKRFDLGADADAAADRLRVRVLAELVARRDAAGRGAAVGVRAAAWALVGAGAACMLCVLAWRESGDRGPSPRNAHMGGLTPVAVPAQTATALEPVAESLPETPPLSPPGEIESPSPPRSDLVIKILTDNPNIVIYWLANDTDEEGTTHDSTV